MNSNRQNRTIRHSGVAIAALIATAVTFAQPAARAQCPVTQIASGLEGPLGITISNKGNLLVSEKGTRTPNTGRISIVDPAGNRRTQIDGLPSGINFEGNNDPSGVGGLFLRGRTLYVAVGVAMPCKRDQLREQPRRIQIPPRRCLAPSSRSTLAQAWRKRRGASRSQPRTSNSWPIISA